MLCYFLYCIHLTNIIINLPFDLIIINVENIYRLELEQLEEAHARDRGIKTKKKKAKKGKGKRGKKKKNKDITAHRTVEDLFQELYDNKIIRTYPAIDLNTFIGDYSYKNYELRLEDLDPSPAVGDIRKIIMKTCIIPLGITIISKKIPA